MAFCYSFWSSGQITLCFPKSFGRPGASTFIFFLSIAWFGCGDQRIQHIPRDDTDLFNGPVEGFFISFRGGLIARNLSHKLKRSLADLFISGWWIEIEQGFNITAHPGFLFSCGLQWNVFFSCDDTDYNSYFGQFIYVIEICLCSLATLRWSSG